MVIVVVATLLLPAGFAGALGRRFSGGLLSRWLGHDLGDLPARTAWACLAVLGALLAQRNWWALVGVGLPVGAMIFGNGGRALRGVLDLLRSLLHGAAVMAAPIAASVWLGHAWWWPVAAATATPACFWLANRRPLSVVWLGCTAGDPGPTGELLCGFLWGVGMVAGLL